MGASDGATPKPKPSAKGAAKAAADADLLAQQAAEELAEKRGGGDDPHPEDGAEAERVADLPVAGDGEHNGSIADAVLEAARAQKIALLSRLYASRHPGEGFPVDEVLLGLEDELLAPPPESAAAPAVDVDGIPPSILALIAAGQAQTAAILGKLGDVIERQADATVQQAGLVGSVEDLITQLDGTVSDGGDGPDPLDDPVTFVSKGKALLVVKKARHRSVGADGSQAFTQGIAADFAPTGQFTSRNREMVAYLRARPGFNREYWELGKEPHAAPNPVLVMNKVIEATLALDDVALAKLETEELASHKRPIVLHSIKTARNRIQGIDGASEGV